MYVVGPDLCLASYANSVREVQGIDINAPAYNKLTEDTKDQLTDNMQGNLSDLLQNAELAEDFAGDRIIIITVYQEEVYFAAQCCLCPSEKNNILNIDRILLVLPSPSSPSLFSFVIIYSLLSFLFLLAGCMDKNDPGKSEEKGDCPDWSMEQVRTNGFMSLAHWEKVMQSDNGALWLKATKDISCGEEIFLAYDVVL